MKSLCQLAKTLGHASSFACTWLCIPPPCVPMSTGHASRAYMLRHPSIHVQLYRLRSIAHACLQDYQLSAADADRVIHLAPHIMDGYYHKVSSPCLLCIPFDLCLLALYTPHLKLSPMRPLGRACTASRTCSHSLCTTQAGKTTSHTYIHKPEAHMAVYHSAMHLLTAMDHRARHVVCCEKAGGPVY